MPEKIEDPSGEMLGPSVSARSETLTQNLVELMSRLAQVVIGFYELEKVTKGATEQLHRTAMNVTTAAQRMEAQQKLFFEEMDGRVRRGITLLVWLFLFAALTVVAAGVTLFFSLR